MRLASLIFLISGSVYASMTGPSKESQDFIEKYKSKYKDEKFLTTPSHQYDIELCMAQKNFTPCELQWCIYNSQSSLSKKWIQLAEESAKTKCRTDKGDADLSDQLNTIKARKEKCLAYIHGGNKKVAAFKECAGALD